MSRKNNITLIMPDREPRRICLDDFHKDCIRLGRGAYHGTDTDHRNDIQIEDGFLFVAEAQCTFFFEKDYWYVVDDNARNATTFQGKRIVVHVLNDGDSLFIGKPGSRSSFIELKYSVSADKTASDTESIMLSRFNKFVIGRSSDCDLTISHPTVSRHHCYIIQEKGGYYIQDNNSTNGVLLNGELLTKKERLRQMDRINIADTVLFYNDGQLSRREMVGGVSVVTEHIRWQVGKEKKYIINDVSLSIRPNEFVAIIGGSGAGKTSLLNCLSGMDEFTSGNVLINGENIRNAGKNLRSLMGYVPQQDIVYDTLTLEGMLRYSAKLRMPADISSEEIEEKITETLELVELKDQRKQLIRKFSGGQRKRASIAVELLASPKLFFLDEPSSGLDPGTEKHLMQMLKRLSDSGRTVILVTHTVQNIDLCDRIICMGKGGRLCFSGSPDEALSFFGKDSMTDVYDSLNFDSKATARRFNEIRKLENDGVYENVKSRRIGISIKPRAYFRQMGILTTRYAEILMRDPPRLLLLIIMPVVLTLLVCIAYQADGNFYVMIEKPFFRESYPFLVGSDTQTLISGFACAVFWVGIFNSIQEISKERIIYEREKFSGVGVLPYLFSKFFVLLQLCLIQSLIMTGLLIRMSHTTAVLDVKQPEASSSKVLSIGSSGAVFSGNAFWVEIFLTTLLCALSAMCLGLLISSIASNEMALVLCPICLMPQILFSGIAAKMSGMVDTLSRLFVSCRWGCIAYLTSVDVNSMIGAFKDGKEDASVVWDPVSAYSRSSTYLFGKNPVISAWIALGLMSLGFIVLSGITLRFKKHKGR